jgi:hypothetical protein
MSAPGQCFTARPPAPPPADVNSTARLEALAVRLGRLSPSWRDQERFAVERSELVAHLRRLARHGERHERSTEKTS